MLGIEGIPFGENGKNKLEGAESQQLDTATSRNGGPGPGGWPNGLDFSPSLRMLCKSQSAKVQAAFLKEDSDAGLQDRRGGDEEES